MGWSRLPHITERKHFPKLESFLHEVMRHTTLLPSTIPHMTIEDTILHGHHIPKNTVIFINQWSANHDSRYWESPEKFISKRFLNSEGELVPKPSEQYIIFSAGARKCPGDQYTLQLAVHLVATLLSVCTLLPCPEAPPSLKLKYNLTMRPSPFKVRIRLRKAMLYQKMLDSVHTDIKEKRTYLNTFYDQARTQVVNDCTIPNGHDFPLSDEFTDQHYLTSARGHSRKKCRRSTP